MSKKKLFQVYLPEDVLSKLLELKEKTGVPVAEFIRRCLKKELENEK